MLLFGCKKKFLTYCFPHPNSTVTYKPIDENKIKLLADKSINPICWLEQGLIMVTMGRLVPQKGYDRLLPIIKKIKRRRFSFLTKYFGRRELSGKNSQQHIKQHHLETCVRLSRISHQPLSLLGKSRFICLFIAGRGHSTVITEALILGLPIITTRCAGMQELLGEKW